VSVHPDTSVTCLVYAGTNQCVANPNRRLQKSFKLIGGGDPIAEPIARVLHPADGAMIELVEKLLQDPDLPARIGDAAVKMASSSELPR